MIKDLSRHHQPVGTLFAHINSSTDWEQYRLSMEQVEFFTKMDI